MTLKERIENNLTVWLMGTLLTGFLAGVSTYRAILEIAKLDVVPRSQTRSSPQSASESDVPVPAAVRDELRKLTDSHNARLQALHTRLLDAEKEATSFGNIDSVQEKYRQSAERIEASIKEENESFTSQIRGLHQLDVKP